ncbi:Uncharacterized protein HZ326_9772 [Fusarium oxysporum f. sp. albedinis]|nr:Uncharacterized protein HZ326_9772 [Fusarium oxysporum f. sp. albedinis]
MHGLMTACESSLFQRNDVLLSYSINEQINSQLDCAVSVTTLFIDYQVCSNAMKAKHPVPLTTYLALGAAFFCGCKAMIAIVSQISACTKLPFPLKARYCS